MLARRDTLGPFERAASGNAEVDDDSALDGDLVHRPSTALNLLGASIRDSSYPGEPAAPRGAPSIVLPHQEASYVRHIALDIGGSLIKLVYFSPDSHESSETTTGHGDRHGDRHGENGRHSGHHHKGGRMHFVKFETARIQDCLDFIQAKGLHRTLLRDGSSREVRVKATGGGAIKFADIFKERLGLVLEREDEIGCSVGGCNFLLRTITHEAFNFEAGQAQFVPCSNVDSELFPYLLVNIGSGVSIIRVDGPGEDEYCRVSGSSVGGGTFWGLCRLLTGRRDFDEMLELSMQGNNANVDMLVGDIYGGRDYSSIGLSATTIACSFGKVVGQDKDLGDYNPADMAMSLCRMVAYNIGQLAYMHAKRYDLKRVFFGGFFIRGHPYTMETISFAIKFWSQGEMSALFLRHEGFLGAVGAFLKVHPMHVPTSRAAAAAAAAEAGGVAAAKDLRVLSDTASSKVRARFVERFSMGAPFAGGEVHGPAIRDMSDRVSWVEKFVAVGQQQQQQEHQQQQQQGLGLAAIRGPRLSAGTGPPTQGLSGHIPHLDRSLSMPIDHQGGYAAGVQPPSPTYPLPTRIPLHVGVLHYSPTQEPFPLLADPASYLPNTIDINTDEAEYKWLLQVLEDQVPTVVEKAIKSEGGGEGPRRRAAAFGRAFTAHLQKLRQDPGAYGQLGLSDLFEMREECLREFGFSDVYRLDKEAENDVALQVLPDLLTELDAMHQKDRLLAIIQGILAANIFDWGAKACVELYTNGTILDIYREARRKLSKRPWRVDDFDDFLARVFGDQQQHVGSSAAAAATAAAAGGQDQDIQQQLQGLQLSGQQQQQAPLPGGSSSSRSDPAPAAAAASPSSSSSSSPGSPGSIPPFRRVIVFVDNAGADIVLGMLPFVRELLRLRCEVVMVANSLPAINDITAAELRLLLSAAAEVCPIIKRARSAALAHEAPGRGTSGLVGAPSIPPYPGLRQRQSSAHDLMALAAAAAGGVGKGAAAAGGPAVGLSGGSLGGMGNTLSGFGSPLGSLDGGGLGHSIIDQAAAAAAAAGNPIRQPESAKGNFAPDQAMIQQQQQQGLEWQQSSSSSGTSSPEAPFSSAPATTAAAVAAAAVEPKLFVLGNGSGSPCLDLSRVPAALADATVGVDLLVIEGMGRAIHTNLRTRFKCDTLKLAMIKTERLARKLFNGQLYDCMCMFQRAAQPAAAAGGSNKWGRFHFSNKEDSTSCYS